MSLFASYLGFLDLCFIFMGNTSSWPFVCLYLARRCEVPSSVTKSNPSQNSHLTKLSSCPHMFNFLPRVVKRGPSGTTGHGPALPSVQVMQSKTILVELAVVPPMTSKYYRARGIHSYKVNRAGVGSYFPPRTNTTTTTASLLSSSAAASCCWISGCPARSAPWE